MKRRRGGTPAQWVVTSGMTTISGAINGALRLDGWSLVGGLILEVGYLW